MRKYIHVAKLFKPLLTSEAANYIAEEYSRLRSQEQLTSDVARVSSSIIAACLKALQWPHSSCRSVLLVV